VKRAKSDAPRLTAAAVRNALRDQSDPTRAEGVARFFKCGPGEYGEGDTFIGVSLPALRRIVRTYRDLPLADVDSLLMSPVHEERLAALLILVDQFGRATDERRRKQISSLYMKRLRFINNWDLVDCSAAQIVGAWLEDKPRDLLDRLAQSAHLWSRRVAMIATYHYIRQGDHRDAVRIAALLVHDDHDLIHKAAGWMLREVGKRASGRALEQFLRQHAATMPRTMLRYAVERLPPDEHQRWMTMKAAPPRTASGGRARATTASRR
jgi:3-methyladenine DNA glycosylase AlkD